MVAEEDAGLCTTRFVAKVGVGFERTIIPHVAAYTNIHICYANGDTVISRVTLAVKNSRAEISALWSSALSLSKRWGTEEYSYSLRAIV